MPNAPHEPISQTLALRSADLRVALAMAAQVAGPRLLRRGHEVRVVPSPAAVVVAAEARGIAAWLARIADGIGAALDAGARITLRAGRDEAAGVLAIHAAGPRAPSADPADWIAPLWLPGDPPLHVVSRDGAEATFVARLPLREPASALRATGS